MFELLIILLLTLLNGVFSGAEIAVLSVRKTRLQALVDEGSRRAKAVLALRDQPDRFLATVQVGITVIGASAAAFGGSALTDDVAGWLGRLPLIGVYAEQFAFAVVIGGVSFLSLVLGELVPKSMALRAGEKYALLIGPPLGVVAQLARPLVWFLTLSSNLVLRPFGDRTTFSETRLSPEELQQLVEDAARVGAVDKRVSDIASRAIDFGNLVAEEIMVPRGRVVCIQEEASADELREALRAHGHTRMPVYRDNLDDIVGYVTAKDLLEGPTRPIREIIRPAFFVPPNMRAVDLLHSLQKRRMQLAVVASEHGGLAGVVTLEDVLEELVGEIFNEHDKPNEAITIEADGSALVQGQVPIREVNRALGIELPEGDTWSTLAGFAIAKAGRIPERGIRIGADDGVELEIVEASARQIRSIRVRVPGRPAEAVEGAKGR